MLLLNYPTMGSLRLNAMKYDVNNGDKILAKC